jgi:predicted PurR-regulated permease PerM
MAWRIAGWVVIIIATLAFFYAVRGALPPFIIGGVIALLLNPTVEKFINARKVSRARAVFNVTLGFLLLAAGIGIAVVPTFYSQAQQLIAAFAKNGQIVKTIQENAQDWQSQLKRELNAREALIRRNEKFLQRYELPTEPDALADTIVNRATSTVTGFATSIGDSFFKNVVGALLNLLSKLLWFVLIPIIIFLFLMEMDNFQRAFLFLIPPSQRHSVRLLLDEIGSMFLRYIRGLVTVALTYGITAGIVYWLLGVPNPLLVGALAGVLYPVPYIGAASTALISGGFTYLFEPAHPFLYFLDLPLYWHALAVVLTGAVMNILFDMIITPRILGGAVGLSPLASLFAILVGAQIAGVWGMLLAVPVATTFKIIIERLLYYVYGEAEFLDKPEDEGTEKEDGRTEGGENGKTGG